MTKHKRTKLSLDRATIRALTTSQLDDARGGATGEPCDTFAATKCDFGCATGGNVCAV